MKMRYYIQPLKKLAKSSFEGRLWEIVVAIISGMFAYKGYQAKLALLLFPMGAVCFICIAGLTTSLFFWIRERLSTHNTSDE